MLMDYTADTQREYNVEKLVDEWIKIEDLDVEIDSVNKTVIDADTAYLVATSDAKKNRPVIVCRRMTEALASADTTSVGKERVVIDTGNMINVGSNRKFSRGKAGFEEYAAVLINSTVVAKFTRA